MKEIIELNKKLRMRIAGLSECPDGLTISSDDLRSDREVIPEDLRPELDLIIAELNRFIPNDFSYSIYFGEREPFFGLAFEDGMQSRSFRNTPCYPHETIAEAFGEIDWDEERQGAIAECQKFDRLKEELAKAPPRIPTTKSLHREFADEMKPWIKAVRKSPEIVHVMMWRDDEDLIKEEFKTLEAFTDELPNLMTVEFHIVAVVTGGKPLPAARIDAMKQRALEALKDMPISYAKASGRFSGSTLIPGFRVDESD